MLGEVEETWGLAMTNFRKQLNKRLLNSWCPGAFVAKKSSRSSLKFASLPLVLLEHFK